MDPFGQLQEQVRRNLGILPKPDFTSSVEETTPETQQAEDDFRRADPSFVGPLKTSPPETFQQRNERIGGELASGQYWKNRGNDLYNEAPEIARAAGNFGASDPTGGALLGGLFAGATKGVQNAYENIRGLRTPDVGENVRDMVAAARPQDVITGGIGHSGAPGEAGGIRFPFKNGPSEAFPLGYTVHSIKYGERWKANPRENVFEGHVDPTKRNVGDILGDFPGGHSGVLPEVANSFGGSSAPKLLLKPNVQHTIDLTTPLTSEDAARYYGVGNEYQKASIKKLWKQHLNELDTLKTEAAQKYSVKNLVTKQIAEKTSDPHEAENIAKGLTHMSGQFHKVIEETPLSREQRDRLDGKTLTLAQKEMVRGPIKDINEQQGVGNEQFRRTGFDSVKYNDLGDANKPSLAVLNPEDLQNQFGVQMGSRILPPHRISGHIPLDEGKGVIVKDEHYHTSDDPNVKSGNTQFRYQRNHPLSEVRSIVPGSEKLPSVKSILDINNPEAEKKFDIKGIVKQLGIESPTPTKVNLSKPPQAENEAGLKSVFKTAGLSGVDTEYALGFVNEFPKLTTGEIVKLVKAGYDYSDFHSHESAINKIKALGGQSKGADAEYGATLDKAVGVNKQIKDMTNWGLSPEEANKLLYYGFNKSDFQSVHHAVAKANELMSASDPNEVGLDDRSTYWDAEKKDYKYKTTEGTPYKGDPKKLIDTMLEHGHSFMDVYNELKDATANGKEYIDDNLYDYLNQQHNLKSSNYLTKVGNDDITNKFIKDYEGDDLSYGQMTDKWGRDGNIGAIHDSIKKHGLSYADAKLLDDNKIYTSGLTTKDAKTYLDKVKGLGPEPPPVDAKSEDSDMATMWQPDSPYKPKPLEFDSYKKLEGAKGSNPGGVYQGPAGYKYYIKQYKNPDQHYNEQLANEIYRDLGISVPHTEVGTLGGKPATKSDWEEKAKPYGSDYSKEDARKFLNGFAADAFLGNWDAIGLGGDNAHMDKMPLRMDNGGALLYRAQGEKKPDNVLNFLDEFKNYAPGGKNSEYGKMFERAGYKGPEDIPNLKQQINNILEWSQSGQMKHYVEGQVPDASPEYKARVTKMLESRLQHLSSYYDKLVGK